MKILSKYKNGNYIVTLYEDGTKIKENNESFFDSEFPDSFDLKITDYCDNNCPMCHENSSILGKHGNLSHPIFDSLPNGIEIAIGGGNPLSHPDLISFLKKMKNKNIICNMTVNENHFLKNINLIKFLIKEKLIFGLGISLTKISEETLIFASEYKNTVFHVINGIFMDYHKIANKGYKILILGYKKFGRGESYFNKNIDSNMFITKKLIQLLFKQFKIISFDNLAIDQLDIKSLLKDEFDSIYMGNDGESSMYIDLVNEEFAISSTSLKRYKLENNLIKCFQIIKATKCKNFNLIKRNNEI